MTSLNRMTRRRFCAGLGSLSVLLPLAGCDDGKPRAASSPSGSSVAVPSPATGGAVASAPTPGAAGRPKDVVKVGSLATLSDAPFYIGLAKGWYDEAGIDLQTTEFPNAAQMVPPLSQGQLDAGGGAPSAGLNNAVARDLGIKIVADRAFVPSDSSSNALLVRKDLADRVKSFADLKGFKFAIPSEGAALQVTVDRGMRTAGLTFKDLDPVYMAFPDMIAAFGGGSIQAASVVEPHVTLIAARGLAVIFKRSNEYSPNNQAAVLLYGARFTEGRPDGARRFMVPYLRSVRLYNDAFFKTPRDQAAFDEVVGILTKATTVKDPALYAQMQLPAIHPDGKIQIQSLKDDQEWYLQNGYQRTRIDLDAAVDTSYAEYAGGQLGGPYRQRG